MNEHIKLLVEQAFVITTDGKIGHANNYMVEKFAEMLVKECVTVMYDSAIKRKVPPDLNQTPTYYAVAVLEHFGVEL